MAKPSGSFIPTAEGEFDLNRARGQFQSSSDTFSAENATNFSWRPLKNLNCPSLLTDESTSRILLVL